MSEPPEQEEVEEPEDPAAGADLEELLEQFREPEEPRRKSANPLWLISAFLLSALACWLALRASGGGGGDKPESAALAGAMLPGKTSERLPRDEEPVDVVEDYLARCKKGMTAQEVRWIVEDFQRAGLDLPPQSERIEKYVAVRLAQHRWYLDLLDDGLGLDAGQRRVASEKLWLLADEATQRVAKELMEHDASVEKLLEKKPQILEDLIDAEIWLADERYAPWELCELNKDQLRLTWFESVAVSRNAQSGSAMLDPERPWWDPEISSMIDPLSGAGSISDYPTGEAPDKVNGAGSIFPFAKSQRFRSPDHDSAGPVDLQAMRCHPAQLKTSLLARPQLAAQLMEGLDSSEE